MAIEIFELKNAALGVGSSPQPGEEMQARRQLAFYLGLQAGFEFDLAGFF